MQDLHLEAALPRARLDRDYSARATVTGEEFDRIIALYLSQSLPAYALPESRRDLAFGPEGGPRLDLLGTNQGELRPLFVFIHGGYWRALSKEHSAFMAPMLEARGIATASVDYRLAPTARMSDIVADVRAAFAWLWQRAAELGIDRDRIIVGGSSAGGHLAGTLLSPGWQEAHGLPADAIKGALPVSGLFELAPIAASHVQDWMHLTPEEVAAFSPIRHLPAAGDIVVALAEQEAPGFHRQSRAYCARLQAAGLSARLLEIPARNHFDVILDLADESSTLSRALLSLFEGLTG